MDFLLYNLYICVPLQQIIIIFWPFWSFRWAVNWENCLNRRRTTWIPLRNFRVENKTVIRKEYRIYPCKSRTKKWIPISLFTGAVVQNLSQNHYNGDKIISGFNFMVRYFYLEFQFSFSIKQTDSHISPSISFSLSVCLSLSFSHPYSPPGTATPTPWHPGEGVLGGGCFATVHHHHYHRRQYTRGGCQHGLCVIFI